MTQSDTITQEAEPLMLVLKESPNYTLVFNEGWDEADGDEGPYQVINSLTGFADVTARQYLAALQSMIKFVEYHDKLEAELEGLVSPQEAEGRQNVFDFSAAKKLN